MSDTALATYIAIVLVLSLEHLILTRVYHKTSSVMRLLRRSGSAKADLLFFVFYYFVWAHIATYALLFTLPGLANYALHMFGNLSGFQGLLPMLGVVPPVAWLVSLLAIDLVTYASHRMLHEIPALWHMHRIHHSATEMTIANGVRNSIAEQAFHTLVIYAVLSLLMGLPELPVAFAILLAYRLVDMVQHSDLPWDYGWLDRLVASPRFHRMHHSSEIADHDSNYGNILSVWDHLFGTVSKRYRASRAHADTCVLGLHDPGETASINANWRTVLGSGMVPPFVSRWWERRGGLLPGCLFRAGAVAMFGRRELS